MSEWEEIRRRSHIAWSRDGQNRWYAEVTWRFSVTRVHTEAAYGWSEAEAFEAVELAVVVKHLLGEADDP